MKIGILTFHWASNYGAVLQAYALQKFLEQMGNDVEIIDYYPSRYKKNLLYLFSSKRIRRVPEHLLEIRKERKIVPFRDEMLKKTSYYPSNNALKKAEFNYDCVICGSDQIWNESFLQCGEGKKTCTYFLDFVKSGVVKASYAASFGTVQYAEELKNDLKRMLHDFDFISVREYTGLDILKDVGIDHTCVTPDPTLLLDPACYMQHVTPDHNEKNAFVYMLHEKKRDAIPLVHYAKKSDFAIRECGIIGIRQWLSAIFNSDLVITNSFHGVVFSVLFHRPFVAILIDGSGMNDRIVTLLNKLGLQERIFNGDTSIIDKEINWNDIDIKLADYRHEGYEYIMQVLNFNKKG